MSSELEILHELKNKIALIESAFSYIQSGTEKIAGVEHLIFSVQEKLGLLEGRLSSLLESLTRHVQVREERIHSLEKRVLALEMKESLLKQAYQPNNLKN